MAAATEPANRPPIADAKDTEIDQVLAEAGGDPRRAIRNLLHDLTALALDIEATVSRGYVRSRLLPVRGRRLSS